jgi:hypothetical protein
MPIRHIPNRLKIIFFRTLPNPVISNFLTQTPLFDNQAVSSYYSEIFQDLKKANTYKPE